MKFILIAAFLFVVQAQAAYRVQCFPGHVELQNPQGSQVFSTVQEALNAAQAGAKIFIGKGFYDEKVKIKNKQNITVKSFCGATLANIEVQNSTGIILDYLRLSPGSSGGGKSGLIVEGKNNAPSEVALMHSEIFGADEARFGVQAKAHTRVTLWQNYIHDNRKSAVVLERNSGPHFILENRIERSGWNGLEVEKEVQATLQGNTIVGNGVPSGANKNSYGILADKQSPAPLQILLLNNAILNNDGKLIQNTSSKDLGHYASLLDATDNSNTTSLGQEGPGISTNQAPIARAGRDQSFSSLGQVIKLSGQASTDREGNALQYSWVFTEKPQNSQAQFASQSVLTQFTADQWGTYVVELRVTENGRESLVDTITISSENSRPVALAGSSQKVNQGQTVVLDGSASFDHGPNPQSLNYHWRFVGLPENSQAELLDPASVSPSFVVDAPGDYELELVVHDGAKFSKPAFVRITTGTLFPEAVAGPDRVVLAGVAQLLDGTASQIHSAGALSYQWHLLAKPENSQALLQNPQNEVAHFVPDLMGAYVAQLTVTDALGQKSQSTVLLQARLNQLPVAVVGVGGEVPLGASVTLNGLASTDADGDVLSYLWTLQKPQSSTAQIFDPNAGNTSFIADKKGTYTATLVVNDGYGSSAPAQVSFIVAGNTAPTANAGPDITVLPGQSYALSGALSSDPENDPLSYEWKIVQKPQNTFASIANPETVAPNFFSNDVGVYQVSLVVKDGELTSAPDLLTVTVAVRQNTAPSLAPITNYSLVLGSEIELQASGSDVDADDLQYFIQPGELPEGSSFEEKTGKFKFRPVTAPAQYTFSIKAYDGREYSGVRTFSVNVSEPAPGTSTSISGTIVDAMQVKKKKRNLPVAGVQVEVVGTGLTTTSDSNGNFSLNNLPNTSPVLRFVAANYVESRATLELLANTVNQVARPFYLTPIDASSVQPVLPSTPLTLTNSDTGATAAIPADAVKNEDGTPFTGSMSFSEIPLNLTPVPLSEDQKPAQILSLQPLGLDFASPVTMQIPNTDELEPGSTLSVFGAEAGAKRFRRVGQAIVSATGEYVTVTGVVKTGTYFVLSEPTEPFERRWTINNKACLGCASSNIHLGRGSVRSSHQLPSFKSFGENKFYELRYDSNAAYPTMSMNIDSQLSPLVSLPNRYSVETFIKRRMNSGRVFKPTRGIQRMGTVLFFQGEDVGVIDVDVRVRSIYANSEVGTSFRTSVLAYHEQDSIFGKGWMLNGLGRIYPSNSTNPQYLEALIVSDGDGTAQIFQKPNPGSTVWNGPDGDFSFIQRTADGYVRTFPNRDQHYFNEDGFLQRIKGKNGRVTIFCYFPGTNRLQYIQDPGGLKTNFVYSGDRVSQIVDSAGRITKLFYNIEGTLSRIEDPTGDRHEFGYDGQSNFLLWDCRRSGGCQSYRINDARMVTGGADSLGSEWFSTAFEGAHYRNFENNGVNDPILPTKVEDIYASYKNPDGLETKMKLNATGSALSYESSDGYRLETPRNTLNLVQTMSSNSGESYSFQHESSGFVTQIVDNVAQSTDNFGYDIFKNITLLQKNNRTHQFQRDAQGNLSRYINPINREWFYDLNDRGLATSRTDPENYKVKYSYDNVSGNVNTVTDESGRVQRLTYDAAGNVIEIKDGAGKITRYEYDGNNNVTSIENAMGHKVTFTYYAKDLVETIKDQRQQETRFFYNAKGQVSQIVYPDATSDSFVYNKRGALVQKTRANGVVTVYGYDGENRLVSEATADVLKTYTYDVKGRMTGASEGGITTNFGYDHRDRLSSMGTVGNGYGAYTFTYSYNAQDELIARADPVGGVVEYQRNAAGDVIQVVGLGESLGMGRDFRGRMSSITTPGFLGNFVYSPAGEMTSIDFKKGQLSQNNYQYSYDRAGNRMRQRQQRSIPGLRTDATYSYDELDQLLVAPRAEASLPVETFQYDEAGNRIRRDGEGFDAFYSNMNARESDGRWDYEYTGTGELRRKRNLQNGEEYLFSWDGMGRLTRLEYVPSLAARKKKLQGYVATYKYDALDRRIEKTINGQTTKYVWDGQNIAYEVREENNQQITKKYLHGEGLDEILYSEENGEKRYYQRDGMNSVIAVTDGNGDILESYTYEAYGKRRVYAPDGSARANTEIRNYLGFTGHRMEEAGLIQMRARYYDVNTGTFISRDPIGVVVTRTNLVIETNLYRYVGNNPLRYTDPLGLDRIEVSNGTTILYCDQGNVKGIYPSTTGRSGVTDPSVVNAGPTPPGTYYINPGEISKGGFLRSLTGDWGTYRAPMWPYGDTNTYGRTGFFMHGGSKPGSAGCVDVGDGDRALFEQLKQHVGPIPVTVR